MRVNHVKFRVLFRRAELVALAEERLSPVASQVYDHLLRRLERDIPFCGFDTRCGLGFLEMSRVLIRLKCSDYRVDHGAGTSDTQQLGRESRLC